MEAVKIEVKKMPRMRLAYVTQIGVARLPQAFDTLMRWAIPKGLMDVAEVKALVLYHDSLKLTPHHKARLSACISLQDPTEVAGEVGLMTLEESRCIVGRHEISIHDFATAWSTLFVWMNKNGYKKANLIPYEIHHNNFNEHPEKQSIVDMCIPIN